ncbi:MAG: hypothetical protein V2I37_04980 [Marinilabiliaceae bacterium]|jgi:antitoxin component YwqK of YwqJK toxin-antitoxin module|nr:hypothetical protein [Marinilabiliaceae bacterium]
MKKLSILLLLTCISGGINILLAQQSLEDGYQVFKYPNGSISSEGTIRDGKPDGYWKSYYVTGVLKSEGARRNFMLDSIWVFYTQTGDTLEKINYLFGKKSGYYYKYKRDNNYGVYIYSRELFAGDKREGNAIIYFPGGNVKQTLPYSNGKKQGLSREYDSEGNIITLYEYNNDFLVSRERINRTDNKGLKQGDWKEFHDNGTLKKEMNYRNDLLHGYYKEYNERGIMVLAMLYDMGQLVEESVEDDPDIEIKNRYDSEGRLIYSGPYRKEIPVGIHREYNKDGEITASRVYNDEGVVVSEGIIDEEGNKSGKWINFYPDGNIMEEGSYQDNRKTGTWNYYSRSGKIIQKGSFRNGRNDGRWYWYYDDGNILREEDYYQGRRDGEFIEYSKTGEIISRGQYTDNEKNGEWIYTVGDYREEGNYIIGLRDGVWKYFDNEGNLTFKGNYLQGNPEGYHRYYWENGKIKEEQYYRSGIRQRSWKKYDIEGLLVMTITYKDDVEKRINGVKVGLPESDVKLIK